MRITMIFFACLLSSSVRSQDLLQKDPASAQEPYVEREEKQFNFYPGGKIEIAAGVPGNVKITGWQKGSVQVKAEKIAYYASADRARDLISQFPIHVRYTQTSARILTSGPAATGNDGAQVEINLTIYVPKDKTDISAKLVRGDFDIESVNGWIEATLREGSLNTKSLSGYFSGSTQRGDIRVEMSGHRWSGLEFDAVTQSGFIDLRLPVEYSAALQLQTRNGKVAVDYPPQVVDGEPTPPQILIRKNAQSLSAAVGDGGAPIKLVTYAGDVTLRKQ
jgi:DUF4097 and DUF4098 domain-containing protein YvlB